MTQNNSTNSFTTTLQSTNGKTGLFEADVISFYHNEEGTSEHIDLRVTIYKKEELVKKEISTIAIKYNIETKEYIPLLGAETNQLYGSVILMLEESLGSSWGYEMN